MPSRDQAQVPSGCGSERTHRVLNAGYHHLVDWVRHDKQPPTAQPIQATPTPTGVAVSLRKPLLVAGSSARRMGSRPTFHVGLDSQLWSWRNAGISLRVG
ncbi:alpha/beta hydrolase domain-containing protein [Saccharopolyspora shandongensis]|uniref:alpha/beta hydrolase domain-containing protein n=1 Tax=Saccharopolyspora shandongensis TaxID=418495 RepID=UPI00342D8C8B